MKNLSLILFLLVANAMFSQEFKPFVGKMVYAVDFSDSLGGTPFQTTYMTVFTNDTIVRVEAESNQIGKQITIRHLTLNKYYILLELNNQKFAIQHQASSDTSASKYTFKNKIGRKKFCGLKAKKVSVSNPNFKDGIPAYYFKNYSPKYLEALKGIQGLPVDYYLQTEEGFYHYRLIEFKQENIARDLFGVPSDYQKVTFDEFMKSMMKTN
ncbi:MAG: hypothetical protein ACK5B9_04760 [Flavobacteriia bacterium]|jgi:hypothetical protein